MELFRFGSFAPILPCASINLCECANPLRRCLPAVCCSLGLQSPYNYAIDCKVVFCVKPVKLKRRTVCLLDSCPFQPRGNFLLGPLHPP